MKYIKTPVEQDRWYEFADVENDGTKFDAIAIQDSKRDQIILVPSDICDNAEGVAQEVVLALNERDDLIAQRDVLAEACTKARLLTTALVRYYDIILQDEVMDKMVSDADRAIKAALAKVRGEGET